MVIVEHFGEDYRRREGHGNALISKETLYIAERKMWIRARTLLIFVRNKTESYFQEKKKNSLGNLRKPLNVRITKDNWMKKILMIIKSLHWQSLCSIVTLKNMIQIQSNQLYFFFIY